MWFAASLIDEPGDRRFGAGLTDDVELHQPSSEGTHMTSFESYVSRYWWTILLRGIAAIVFGLLALLAPGVTLAVLVLLFGVYALVDGIGAIILGIKDYGDREHWWATLIGGIVGVAAGLVTFVMPGITAVALLALIASWAIVRGILDIVAAIRLRHAIEGEWLLALAGGLSVTFGLLMMAFPGVGALAVIWWIGAFAIALGAALVALSFRVRDVTRAAHA
jgi:uncharacterized membrane protein HdeD (DUF308 family)